MGQVTRITETDRKISNPKICNAASLPFSETIVGLVRGPSHQHYGDRRTSNTKICNTTSLPFSETIVGLVRGPSHQHYGDRRISNTPSLPFADTIVAGCCSWPQAPALRRQAARHGSHTKLCQIRCLLRSPCP